MNVQIYSVIIINKTGTLQWMRDFSEKPTKRTENDPLYLASSFHGFSVVASQINPLLKESDGIQKIQTSNFSLQCLHTQTGVEFLVIASPQSAPVLGEFLSQLYILYTDYVLKNPFIISEMIIKSKKFETKVRELVTSLKGNSQ
ncbi:Synbindin, putative [Entamoeba histolytica HM-1:IMSS-B]|uniref:Trafficking protein particle complex subunit n=6 Tax=Entamoeba histolytica TaxID=5759 RepID=C4LWX2_ENTH1|nr:Synbindin, putative [Entamoeba histolytica HM-1:IMSS]EMD48652.1 synbindin, putative [Entamoeba histolytica KU27]EMH72676.1 Synbindin, putative [Entamoeba histolytica HM-1:IMSS-B]EMS13924.1 Synbindin, putative [Entamoeba histolytica HM-3:IMSS]ENY64654.1 Synbindin, putative [Entamoeba histolytica HM-1:IMSS-A]GAT93217.1 synbindin putative [Entamoeba histolytica]|eukprot:XP_651547.1 Synbindin, putative [Entamoeba histolytica HM-1:IMSS]